MIPPVKERLEAYAKRRKLEIVEKIGKGYSSEIYLVKDATEKNAMRTEHSLERVEALPALKFALKIEKPKSPRQNMAKKEAENLALANRVGVGPRLIDYDGENRIILMEYVEGKTMKEFIFSKKAPSKTVLQKFLTELFQQAGRLDKAGLSHGQLAGKGTNILVRKNLPVIIDFEKASAKRKCNNVLQLTSLLVTNKKGAMAGKVKGILGG